MLNIEYYFDQNRKTPYIYFCGMVLPFYILKNKMPLEINLSYDVRENELFYNDKPSKTVQEGITKSMNRLYEKLKERFVAIEDNEDYRQNLVLAYFYQELAEIYMSQNENRELRSEQIEKAFKNTKLYCALSGLSTGYISSLEGRLQCQL